MEPCKKILFNNDQIQVRCKEIAAQISKDYADKEVIFIGLLKGCNPFLADIFRNVDLRCQIEYMQVTSYQGTQTTHDVKIIKDLDKPVKGKHLIIVDDIVDTGETMQFVMNMLKVKGAESVEVCVLLDKDREKSFPIHARYVGFKVENEFVVGYGLDYNGYYRNLNYIGSIKEELIEK